MTENKVTIGLMTISSTLLLQPNRFKYIRVYMERQLIQSKDMFMKRKQVTLCEMYQLNW